MPTQTRSSVTIEDVAARAGVSRAAVSKVLRDAYGVSEAMREKVNAAITDLGYRPRVSARAMRGATYTLGIEIPSMSNPFFGKIINGATAALKGTNYQFIIATGDPASEGAPEAAIEMLADRQVDGILAVSIAVGPDYLEELARTTPLVMLGRHDASLGYDTVVDDDLEGARLAVRHLYELGHRRIAHLSIDPALQNRMPTAPHALREAGYRAAMAELGLEANVHVAHLAREGGEAEEAMRLLAGPNRPTAVFAGHDEIALGVLTAVSTLGLTCDDVAVVGYDDTDLAAHPMVSLTSVNQSGTRMGEIVVRLLLERIAGRTEPVHEVIAPKLMSRRTTLRSSEGTH